jgi:hypothetical protein
MMTTDGQGASRYSYRLRTIIIVCLDASIVHIERTSVISLMLLNTHAQEQASRLRSAVRDDHAADYYPSTLDLDIQNWTPPVGIQVFGTRTCATSTVGPGARSGP